MWFLLQRITNHEIEMEWNWILYLDVGVSTHIVDSEHIDGGSLLVSMSDTKTCEVVDGDQWIDMFFEHHSSDNYIQ